MANRRFYLIVYDITDDRRRLKVARYLESLGERVQYSVFEAYLTSTELQRLERWMKKRLELTEDSLRIYHLCADCRQAILVLGQGKVTDAPSVVIV